MSRVQVAVLQCQLGLGGLGERFGHLDTSRTSADDNKGQQTATLFRVGHRLGHCLGHCLGLLEGQQNAVANREGIFYRFSAGATRLQSS